MSYRELTMVEVREVLRRWQAGQPKREIARETGTDRKTVRRYVQYAEKLGVRTDQALDDDVVHEVARCVQDRPLRPTTDERAVLLPHRERIAQWLGQKRPLRLTKVHVLLQREGVTVTYATLRRFAIDELGWRKPTPTVRLEDAEPGDEAQVDFGRMGMMRDPQTGRMRQLWALIVTLTFSRYMFVWPTFEQTTKEACAGLDAAFRFFGAVPRKIVPDNTRAMIAHADAISPRLTDAFADYVQARGVFVDPARVKRPKDKARVENQVPYVRERWFDGEHFDSLEHAREHAANWCAEEAGTRTHGTTRLVPREVFEEHEKPRMTAAPTEPFDVPMWISAKVHPDHHIQVARALYSLPTRFIGKHVRVRADSRTVRIYLGTEQIKMHLRVGPGKRSTDPSDYPPGKSAWAFRTVDALLDKARGRGEHVGQYAARLLSGPLPWTTMRQGYELLRLCDRYGESRVEAACKRALEHDVVDVPRIARMLKHANRLEENAEQSGQLRRLPSAPRFARDKAMFETRREEGDR